MLRFSGCASGCWTRLIEAERSANLFYFTDWRLNEARRSQASWRIMKRF